MKQQREKEKVMIKSRMILGAVLIFSLICTTTIQAGEADPFGFFTKKYIGARLGVWVNTGDDLTGDNENISNSSFYGEFFFSRNLWPALAAEFIIGLYGRGDIEIQDAGSTYQGQLNIYPILVTAKFYPLAGLKMMGPKPYLQAGGGLIVGSRPRVKYDDYYGVYDVEQETEAALSYTLGGGIDFPVADQIALTANFRYTPADFGGEFDGVKDFSGYQITFGAGYIFK